MAVTVVVGLDRDATAPVAAGLLTRTARCASVWVDPSGWHTGRVRYVVDDDTGRHHSGSVAIRRDGVAAAVRACTAEKVRAAAASGDYDTVLVEIAPGVEATNAAEGLCADLAGSRARVDTVVAVLDATTWLADLSGDDEVRERGLDLGVGDRRGVAGLLAAQLDVADRIVVTGVGDDVIEAESALAMSTLAPTARRLRPHTVLDVVPAHVLRTGAHDPRCLHPMSDRGLLDWRHRTPVAAGTLGVVRWRSARPLHPARLFDALDPLADGVVRSAGRLWLAHATGTAVRWDSCGDALHLGPAAQWRHSTHRPGNRLAFLGHDLDAVSIALTLDDCVLTDAEMAGGAQRWERLDHPFPTWRYDGTPAGARPDTETDGEA